MSSQDLPCLKGASRTLAECLSLPQIPLASEDLSLVLVMPGQQKDFVANGLTQVSLVKMK